jgi:parvulin-like peptidyl-prolyl cis-trans isomerase-like protein
MSVPVVDAHSSESLTPRRLWAWGSRQATRLKQPVWVRDPLLHFVVLGGLIFLLDHTFARDEGDPSTIVISAQVTRDAIQTFEGSRGRKPTAEELEALQRIWLDNEVLYREGLALGVDRGDSAIRERVIFKALSVVDSNVKLPAPDETTLRAWFESHRDKYDDPARFDFEEAALSGSPSEVEVRDFVTRLNQGTPGDAQAGLRVFKARPRPNLLESYGPDLTRALEQALPGVWMALQTREGWRAIRLNKRTPPRPAVFDALRGPVLYDWKDAHASEQRTSAVRALAKKYKIRHEDPELAPAARASEGDSP